MKKLFSEAEVELTLLSALEDILSMSGYGGDLGTGSEWKDDWS